MDDSFITDRQLLPLYISTPVRSETGDSDIVIEPLNISMPYVREFFLYAIFYLFLIIVILIIAIAPSANTLTAGFKIVFDNIDSTIRPRHMTEE